MSSLFSYAKKCINFHITTLQQIKSSLSLNINLPDIKTTPGNVKMIQVVNTFSLQGLHFAIKIYNNGNHLHKVESGLLLLSKIKIIFQSDRDDFVVQY